jgi:hypothetical protein
MQEAPMNPEDRTTDTGMLGSEAENPGPGRDTRQTDPDAAPGADDPETTSAMPTMTLTGPGSEAMSVAAPGSDGCLPG